MRNILYIPQPDKSRCCGQAVAAMILRVSLEESARLFGKVLGVPGPGYHCSTSVRHLAKVLQSQGVLCGDRLSAAPKNPEKLPARCVVCLTAKSPDGTRDKAFGQWSHWTLRWDGKWYDPGYGYGIDLGYELLQIKPASYLSFEIP